MKLYCIDLAKLNKIELGEIIKRFKVPLDLEELARLKNSGYNTIYIDELTNKIFFYTLNNAKKTIQIGDYLKNIMIDLKPLGFGAHLVVSEHKSKPVIKKEYTIEEIQDEYDRILDKIHTLGINVITEEEHDFLDKYKNQFE